MNEPILYFLFSFIPWITLSRVKWNIQEMIRFFFKVWRLDRSTAPTKDGPPLCDLPPSYNFNRPTYLLPQVPIIWQSSYIVSFYPQYMLNFFTSPFAWLPDQRNFPPHLWHIKKHLWKCTFSWILTLNLANLKELYNQDIKIQSARHHWSY